MPNRIGTRHELGEAVEGSGESHPPVVVAKVRPPPSASLKRERLQSMLEAVWDHRLGIVIAPAGSGKTTLLAGFAATSAVPVCWYRAESWDADEPSVIRHLEAALSPALPGMRREWRSIEDAAAALDASAADRVLLIVDDAHSLEGTPAERALGRFVAYAPPWLAILIGSRLLPGFNLSRLRVSGELLEIGPNDLRFRAWEVERLFRDYYGDPVPPDELAILARRTEGWAAGLQLFHLATRGKPADERRRILSGAGSSSRLVRDYLTWNVMADLPADLRDFLVHTCVLGRLTGALCDRLLDRRGSAALLDELFRRQIFTVELDQADSSYRYHEILRSHLDRVLVERVGEDDARKRYRDAGALLEEVGATAEALGAFSRAEDWAAVRRLLGGQGERLAEGAPAWLENLPPAIVRNEPWLELASARRARAEGRWGDAFEAYGRAEIGFGTSAIAVVCHTERQAIRAWMEPLTSAPAPADWTRILRNGLIREPLGLARDAGQQSAVPPSLVRGFLALAAGEIAQARREFAAAREVLDEQPIMAAVAALALGVASLLGGDPTGAIELDHAEDAAERAGAPWLARLARSANRLAAPTGDPIDAAAAGATFDANRDPWGAAIVALLEAWDPVVPASGDPRGPGHSELRVAAAERAAADFRHLGAGVLEAWARGLLALGLAEGNAPDAREAAGTSESFARAAGAPGVRLLAYRAMAIADPQRRAEFDDLADAVSRETGLADPPRASYDTEPGGAAAAQDLVRVAAAVGGQGATPATWKGPSVLPGPRFRVFEGFRLSVGDETIALDRIKPRARALLRLLTVHAGSAVHREVIGAALWPEVDGGAAARSLQVAVSAIRGLFGDVLGTDGARFIAREGDAYRLAVPIDAIDVRRFDRLLAEGRAARWRGESPGPALAGALEEYAGDLLPEDGPEEWVVALREHYRALAVEAAREAAETALLEGDPRAASEVCRVGLAIDRYHDPLWRLLIESRSQAGDPSAADRDRREYEAILNELGLPAQSAITAS